ncbi:hypothetical protein [Micromonospora sp. NBRC 107095]|uniref:hypothetical protein n=1 Tax=Micromonospora sp. NBRC 107095 TaxID=3032209 RepID=UPI0024A51AC0|nr:hypothetical protein [Micromonospora sp. NBRC 107095]GLZ57562.1 hypothetical protein Misp05_11380 [Micromonospora sp. NBRC 107095]
MSYYVIYRTDEQSEPAGLFVMDVGVGQAVLWDHRARAWAYDPGLVVRFLDDYRNADRYNNVSRADAEAVVEAVTGGEKLPDEGAIRAMFEDGGGDR